MGNLFMATFSKGLAIEYILFMPMHMFLLLRTAKVISYSVLFRCFSVVLILYLYAALCFCMLAIFYAYVEYGKELSQELSEISPMYAFIIGLVSFSNNHIDQPIEHKLDFS